MSRRTLPLLVVFFYNCDGTESRMGVTKAIFPPILREKDLLQTLQLFRPTHSHTNHLRRELLSAPAICGGGSGALSPLIFGSRPSTRRKTRRDIVLDAEVVCSAAPRRWPSAPRRRSCAPPSRRADCPRRRAPARPSCRAGRRRSGEIGRVVVHSGRATREGGIRMKLQP